MSDSPIFDRVNSERDYTGTMASFRKEMTRYFRAAGYVYVPEQSNLPDPHLDGPYIEAEEEVVVRPFIPVVGIPRGTVEATVELEDGSVEEVAETFSGKKIVTKGDVATIVQESSASGFSFFRTAGVPEKLLEGRTEKEFWESVDLSPEALRAPERALRTQLREKYPDLFKEPEGPWNGLQSGDHILVEDQNFIDPGNAVEELRKSFEEQHPGYVMTEIKGITVNDDGSATLRIEAQELPPIKPLSEKNTAQLME
jgi:hypothetical protein